MVNKCGIRIRSPRDLFFFFLFLNRPPLAPRRVLLLGKLPPRLSGVDCTFLPIFIYRPQTPKISRSNGQTGCGEIYTIRDKDQSLRCQECMTKALGHRFIDALFNLSTSGRNLSDMMLCAVIKG